MVKGVGQEGLAADIRVRHHQFRSGVAEDLGGKDEGPNPHELLEAALAGCTVVTVQMYAKRKGFKLQETTASVKIESEGAQTQISLKISFRGELTEEERARLFEISKKCPIHKILKGSVTIESALV